MAKRKAGVNNIIYELDNEDINASDLSDYECEESKIICIKENKDSQNVKNEAIECENNSNSHSVESTEENTCKNIANDTSCNGGKAEVDIILVDVNVNKCDNENDYIINGSCENAHNSSSDYNRTIIYNQEIDIDSPASTSDLGVVGCENKTPLVSIRFKDFKLAKKYKKKVKEYILSLIKNDKESQFDESDTDLELDLWPEDLSEEELFKNDVPSNDTENLFFFDTDPKCANVDVPVYEQAKVLISSPVEEETSSPQLKNRGPSCFNCGGPHAVRDCPLPKDNARIANNRRNLGVKLGRYHVEDEQKYGHLIPGRISGQLRYALGLKRYEIPMHIYRMRLLGYPPGWLEEARISHSGITMFDSSGTAILDPEEEEGEVNEPGSKDKFDIKKIVDFPGFNVPASSRYKDESQLYGYPPMSEQDSKMMMLQMLAPNAMKAYKRKKLTFFPSAAHNSSQESQEMELDDGDEIPAFPSIPPLPDDEPPPPPPPPSSPPPQSPITKSDPKQEIINVNESDTSQDDIEIIEVMQVANIPVPEDELIIIDYDDSSSAGRVSPTIDDLEAKKKQLLDAIKSSESTADTGTNSEITEVTFSEELSEVEIVASNKNENKSQHTNVESDKDLECNQEMKLASPVPTEIEKTNQCDVNKTPEIKTGVVKNTLYGTPVMNIASPYMKLPSDEKFAKDICDVIQFENLPNSIGKYKKISSLLKKVKSEVDRIQES